MKKHSISAGKLAALVLSSVLLFSGCENKQSAQASGLENIKVAYLPLTHALPLLAAKELADQGKIEKRVNIELVKFSSWPELTDALNANRVDGASLLIELALKAKEQGIDLKAVALGHRDGNVVVAKPEITKTEDLKGKTLAIPHRQSSQNILLQQMFTNANMQLSDVNVVEMPPPEMPSALARGAIDGYCVAEPFGAKAVTLGVGHVLFGPRELLQDFFCCGLILHNAFITAHHDAAEKLAAQYEEAGQLLAADPKLAAEVAIKFLSLDADTLKLSLDWISYNDLDISRETYDILIEKMVKFGLTTNPPSYEDFVAKLATKK